MTVANTTAPDIEAGPRERWLFAAFVLSTLSLTAIGLGALHYLFPFLATVLAVYLYVKKPAAYVRYVLWLWFLSALLRRLVDYRSGWMNPNPILAAPLLASAICLPRNLQSLKSAEFRQVLPFFLTAVCVLYGAVVGFFCLPRGSLAISFASWLSPIFFGFFIFTECREAARARIYRTAIVNTFAWGALIMGIYGIFQLFHPPAWDLMWMQESEDIMGVMGSAEVMGFRIFSTMNSHGPFAIALMVAFVLCLTRKGILGTISSLVGAGALLLTGVRSAWIGCAIGILYVSITSVKNRLRSLVGICSLAICMMLAMTISPLQELLTTRLSTFTDAKSDNSFQDRSDGYERIAASLSTNPLGLGLSAMESQTKGTDLGARDSGILELYTSLGWIGGTVYIVSLVLLFRIPRNLRLMNSFQLSCSAVFVAMLVLLILGDTMVGFFGIVMWVTGALQWAKADELKPAPPVTYSAVAKQYAFEQADKH